ncbi:MAG TPA: translocation/assembly module TamB domain-containing protein [Bryobacteraceae bacterium]|nr:translocation/assembly module TamB domain-containing protein [Bryobacteraceae bacterium]
MTRGQRIFRVAVVALCALLATVFVTTLIVVHTNWFRNFVREQIIATTNEATGGKTEVATFSFDVTHLQAVVTGFVIHGNEPASAQPFVRAAKAQLNFRFFTSIHRLLDITYLGVDRPQVNIVVFPDGRTNIPSPKQRSTSNKSTLETVVDLAVSHFEMTNGLVTFDSRTRPMNIQANNLRAQLYYNTLNEGYQGQLDLEPTYVVSGRNTPVTFRISLPVALQKDRIDIHHATVTTPVSAVSIDGSIANMNHPRINAHVNGHLATIDVQNLADIPLAVNVKGVPGEMELDANAAVDDNVVDVTGLRLTLGDSNIEASGRLKDPNGKAAMQFKSHLALAELGRLVKLQQRPQGAVDIGGTAKLDAAWNYDVTGEIAAKGVSVEQGKQRISNVNLASAMHVYSSGSPAVNTIDLQALKLSALGGEYDGNVSLTDFEKYKVQGSLRHLDIQTAARAMGSKTDYDGAISGPIDLTGDTKPRGTKGIVGSAHLTVAPGKRGIPLSGRLNAQYNGATDNLALENSYLTLPHSRITLNGSVGKQIDVTLTTRNLNDFVPNTPIALTGDATFKGAITGNVASPRVAGHLAVGGFTVEGRSFQTLTADVAATSANTAISNGNLTRGTMQAAFAGNVGLKNWSAPPTAPLAANLRVVNADLADAMALAEQPTQGYSGALTANAQIRGTLGNPQGSANLQGLNGTIDGQKFDQIQAQVNLSDQLMTIPAAFIQSGNGRVNVTAEYHHPPDSFSTGTAHAHVQSNTIDLAQFPQLAGTMQINADANASIGANDFLLTCVNADVNANGVKYRGVDYGNSTITAHTTGQTATYQASINALGGQVRVNGTTQLVSEYPTNADLNVANVALDRALNAVERSDIPAKGTLTASAHLSGTMTNPQGSANIDLSHAVIYSEPLDRVRGSVSYQASSVDVQNLEIVAGPSRIDLAAHYDHPAGKFEQGDARFNITSSHIDLSKIHNAQTLRPGLGGKLDLSANGTVTIHEKDPRILFRALNANLSASGITAEGHSYGDLKFTAATTSANQVGFTLDSDLAGSSIQGRGTAELTADYPVNAQLTFSNLAWARIQPLAQANPEGPPPFDVVVDGSATVNGPVMKTALLNGALRLDKVNFTTKPRPGVGKPIAFSNQGPVSLAMDRGAIRVESAHLTGPQTDLQLSGTASLNDQSLNAAVTANTDIGLLQNFDREIYSAGRVQIGATVRGTFSQPLVNGQLTLQNAAFNHPAAPIGISNASGTIVFNGNSAQVRTLTAEVGGGRVTVTGAAGFSPAMRFGLHAVATRVRVRLQQGVSVTSNADIQFTGTTENSVLSGTATITRISYAPRTDIGSILTRAAPPVQAPSAPSPLLDNMRLDIRVRTSPAMTVESSLAENLQADADLRVRGTASEPGVLGRVNITEGQLVFFGSQYRVDNGTIAFYNPVRIEPILDVSLDTEAKGVTVTVRVTGPVDNMKLSYTSDPPLQFEEIVSLLASGTTPTSDPTLLANQPSQPAQGFQQMGESAIVGKALADPVAGRLQRVFGLSQLKIDPTFTTGSSVPTASVTLQQRISSNLTFTYVTAVDDPNSMIVRVEWAFNPQYSAVAMRDQNGIVSINFFYKRQFR